MELQKAETNIKTSIVKYTIILIGGATIFTGLFGIAYQKGMILAMKLGNLSGNYEIKEIYNSAINSYFDIFSGISKINLIELFSKDSLIVFIIISLAGSLGHYLYFNHKRVVSKIKNINRKISSLFQNTFISMLFTGFISGLLGVFIKIVAVIVAHTVILTIGVILLLPSLLGYISGARYITSKLDNKVCENTLKSDYKQKYVHQCPQFKILGKDIKGLVLLETREAYFIKVNKGFIYLSKKDDTCIYSKYELTETYKKADFKDFEKSQLDDICPVV